MPEEHLLRPEFTQELAEKFIVGASINLISLHGQGRRRTLHDLQTLLPDSLTVQQLDLKRDPIDPVDWLSAAADSSRKTLLILHNFDVLNEGDSNSKQFIEHLNHIGQQPNISLLYVSESERDSPILCELLPLPPLNVTQIMDELTRRNSGITQSELTKRASVISGHPAPYSALKEAVQRPPQ